MIDFEPLPTAIRAYLTRDREPKPARPPARLGRRPQRALVLDCETTTDATQRLIFGAWRLYVDDQTAQPGTTCQQEGIFYADDFPTTDPAGFATLAEYARTRRADVAPGCGTRLWFMSRSEFVERVLWRSGLSDATTIVGYNLPFDLTRIALFATPGRGRNRGGISLCLWQRETGEENKFRPRIAIRAIDAHRNLIWFTHHRDAPDGFHGGNFLDLHTHAFALTDKRGLSLEAACRRFGIEFTKAEVIHGTITDTYIDYCREDVAATAALYRATALEQARHPIDRASTATYSAASIGKAYLTALGIAPFTDRELFFDPEVAGWGMAAFYGGRSECRIRHTDVPVVYVDFASMYPTCNALMNTWPLLCSELLTITDNTREVQALLIANDLRDRLFDPATWPILHTLVEVDPNGATLPVRALYDGETWGIGVNPFHSDRPCWYSLADVLATQLLGGPTPTVQRAWRLEPTEPVDTLNTLNLLGEIPFNPKHDDLFATLVEQRHRIANDPNLDSERRVGLVAWLKVLANATGFGIFAEVQRRDTHQPVEAQVWSDNEPTTITARTPEDPGPYSAPPIAACLTGAARLMLALLEREVTIRNGTYAFCDTDSMAIVATPTGAIVPCPGGAAHTSDGSDAVNALSWDDVNTIVDKFADLNPYNPDHFPGFILKIETENYDHHGQQQELRCWAISAKRYTLTAADGHLAKVSEHGLGH